MSTHSYLPPYEGNMKPAKRNWTQIKRDRLMFNAPEDFAGPDESFPIKTPEDVIHASQRLHNAKDPDAVKKKIIKIAKRKKFPLPDSWM